MPSYIFGNVIALISGRPTFKVSIEYLYDSVAVITVVGARNLGNEDESELLSLRQENSRLSQTLTDLRQNYSGLFTERKSEETDVIRNEDGFFCTMDEDDCVKSAIRLLQESIEVYDGFIENELSVAKSDLCSPTCQGGDMTYSGSCEVSEYVEENIIGPIQLRADLLRDRATAMLSTLKKTLKVHFDGVSFPSVESAE